MSFLITLISGVIIIIGIIIGTQNGNTLVTFYLLKWRFENISLTLLLIESLLFGIVIAVIISGVNQIKMRLHMKSISKKNRALEREIKALKAMPFEEEEEEEEEEVEVEEIEEVEETEEEE